jgi:L-ascorbate metabolism protein UlaG (beta-lactamase superfamily)
VIITYHGLSCFKISQGDLTLAINPISKDSKAGEPTRFGADITLITTNHPDMNGREQTSRGDKESFVIEGPGEYEIKDVFIKGFLSGGPGLINTIYMISFEGMKLCFLGALASAEIPAKTLESLEDIDILFVPIGGSGTLDAAKAYKLAVSLEPSVMIPMHYNKGELEQFVKEGEGKVEPIDKFVVKKKDLEGKETEIVILKEDK